MIDPNAQIPQIQLNQAEVDRRQDLLQPFLMLAGAILIPVIMAFLLVTGSENQALGGLLALLLCTLIMARPFVGLILFTVLLYFRPEELFPGLTGIRYALIISLVSLVGLWLKVFVNREQMVRTPAVIMSVIFGALAVASTVSGGDMVEAASEIGKLVILMLLILNLVRTRDQYNTMVAAVIAGTAFLAAYSMYLYYTGQGLWQDNQFRAKSTGIFGDPNDLAATIAAGIAYTLARAAQNGAARRLLYLLLVPGMVWAIILTNSRGGALALLAVILGVGVTFSKRKVLTGAVAVGLAMLFLTLGPARMTHFDSQEESANIRLSFWQDGITQTLSTPLLGIGYGGFTELTGGGTAHNSFVLCMTELGLPAYFCWMGMLYYAYKRRRAVAGMELELKQKCWELTGARLALTAFLVAGFFLSRTYVPVMYLFIAMPIAWANLDPRTVPDDQIERPELRQDMLRVFGLVVGSMAFIWFLVLKFM